MKFKKKNHKILKEIRIYNSWINIFRHMKKSQIDIYEIKYVKIFKFKKKKLGELINRKNYDLSKSRGQTLTLLRKIEEKLNINIF